MIKPSMRTLWPLLLVCLLTPVLGQGHEEESEIDLEDLLINVQSTLKAFKQDQDEIRKSFDARFDQFEKGVDGRLHKFAKSVDGRLHKFEKSVDGRLHKFEKSVDDRLHKFEKSVDDRLHKFEKRVEEKLTKLERQNLSSSVATIRKEVNGRTDEFGKDDLQEFKTSLAARLDTFDLKLEEKLGQCKRENILDLLLPFTEQVKDSLNRIESRISRQVESTVASTLPPTTLPPTTLQPTTPHTTRNLTVPRDCADVYNKLSQRISGVFTIQPEGSKPFEVFCDMTTDGGGWTVFQKRGVFSGTQERDFYRSWQEYKDGFGDFKAEFWIGLSKISLMTRPENGGQELRIDMADIDGERRYAEYKNFTVQDEKQLFRLSIGRYSGDAGNSLTYHNLQKFTTYDSDNDELNSNCAVLHQGGWWYRGCANSCLNGLNLGVAGKNRQAVGIWWYSWRVTSSIAESEMKFRPMDWTSKNS